MNSYRSLSTMLLLGTIILVLLFSLTNTANADEELIIQRGETASITVLLLQNGTYGNPVPNQVIEFFDQTHNLLLGSNLTNNEGLATIEWTIPLDYPLGHILINATFRGNEDLFLSPSVQWASLIIVSSVQMIIDYVPSLLAPGDLFNFTVLVIDDTGTPIQNASLMVLCNGKVLANAVSNSSGLILFTIHCNNTWSDLGENIIEVIHQVNLNTFYAKSEAYFTVNIQQIITSIEIENEPNEIELGSSLNLEVSLLGIEAGLSSEITVFVNDIFIDTITTDTFGNCSFYLDIDIRFKPGINVLQMVYNGTERFAYSYRAIEFIINSPAIIDIDFLTIPIIGEPFEIKVRISDYFGRFFDGTTITILDTTNGLDTSISIPYTLLDTIISCPISGPTGLHNFQVILVNPFITNSTYYFPLIILSNPILTLKETNIIHFASPNQEINFTLWLTDWAGNCSNRVIHVFINDIDRSMLMTGSDGLGALTLTAPSSEGIYNISFVYTGNSSLYEIATKYDYELTVSYSIPLQVLLVSYEIVPPLQEVIANLVVQCLNGSLLAEVDVRFIWLSQEILKKTQKDGIIVLHLPIPIESGNYPLSYEIISGQGLSYSTGSINVLINLQDILASQGIGIQGFLLSIMISLTTISIPLIRKRYTNR